MAILELNGFDTGDTVFNVSGSTANTSVGAKAGLHTPGKALRTNPSTTNTGTGLFLGLAATGAGAAFNKATLYFGQWCQLDTVASANDEPLFVAQDTTPIQKLEIRVNSAQQLTAYNAAGTLIGTGTTVIPLATPFLLEIKVGTDLTAAPWEVLINKVPEPNLSGTAALLASNNGRHRWGKNANRDGRSVDYYFGAKYTSDSGYIAGSTWAIGVLRPTSDGSTQQWTNGTGATFAEIDEAIVSTADYVRGSGAAGEVALFGLTDCAAAGITGTIHAIRVVLRIAEDSAVASSFSLRIKSGATTSDTTAVDISSVGVIIERIFETDPNTGAAWTLAALDALEAGGIENNAVMDRISTLFVEVLYTPTGGEDYPLGDLAHTHQYQSLIAQ